MRTVPPYRPETRLTPRHFAPPPVAALADEARIQLRAARMWVMLARHQRNPRPVLEALLGAATPAFCTLMATTAAAWPDCFTTYPPCACAVAPDEHCLLALLGHARDNAEAQAHALLGELLPEADRTRLWRAARRATSDGAGYAL